MTERQQQAEDQPFRQREQVEPETPEFQSEPMAGEGVDEDEAMVTRGPGVGGSSGRAGEGTAEDAGGTPGG